LLPVNNRQGIFTRPNASLGSPPRRGLLGLITTAALMRRSVKVARPPGNVCPLAPAQAVALLSSAVEEIGRLGVPAPKLTERLAAFRSLLSNDAL
jgi:hypothetical protein